jgi:hypothetical protein
MPAAAKAPHAPRLHETTYLALTHSECKRTCIWTAASTNADAAGNQYHCPLRQYTSTAADNSRNNPLSQIRCTVKHAAPVGVVPRAKNSHPHTNAAVTTSITRRGTIPARRLISAVTRTARMQTTAVQRRPNLRVAVCTKHFSYNVPL